MFRSLRPALAFVGLLLALTASSAEPPAEKLPRCRLDSTSASVVKATLLSVADAYVGDNRPRLFNTVEVNPRKPLVNPNTMAVYIISDAAVGSTNAQGCATAPPEDGEKLDEFSVAQVCIALPNDRPEIRCSAQAVKIFSGSASSAAKESSGLLYVLAHEVAHLYQRRAGEYAGRIEVLDLKQNREQKIKIMREACDPPSTRFETEADGMALMVLTRTLPISPYRNLVLSERGSMLWHVDHLNMVAQQWQAVSVQRVAGLQPRSHDAFIQTEWPAPPGAAERNAQQFVCDVLLRDQGQIFYPVSAKSHPPIEQRVRRIAEGLQPIADALPEADGQRPFEAVASLQEQVSPILNLMYRETGIYLESVHKAVCTRFNSDDPTTGCSSR
jgi:hypothetical protein